jgi:hypothetical protein
MSVMLCLLICEEQAAAPVAVGVQAAQVTEVSQGGPFGSCTQCHSPGGGSTTIPLDDTEALRPFKRKLIYHVGNGFMPHRASISDTEREVLLREINRIPD